MPHGGGQSRERDLLRRPGRLAEPAVGVLRHVPLALAVRRGGDDCALSVEQNETDRRRPADESLDGRDGGVVDLLATAGRDELDARPSQRQLARCRALLLADEAGHAGDDQQEQDRRCEDERRALRVADGPGTNRTPGAIRQAPASRPSRSGVRRARDSGAGSSSVRIEGWSAAAPQSR